MRNVIKMNRVFCDGDTTLGVADCFGFPCTTLEDEYREVKVAGETRIPSCEYQIKLRTDSPMARRYRERFGTAHRGMLWLQDVPGFTWVYIHVGNDDEDTDGCILIGTTLDTSSFTISHSVAAYTEFHERVMDKLNNDEEVWISITDASIL